MLSSDALHTINPSNGSLKQQFRDPIVPLNSNLGIAFVVASSSNSGLIKKFYITLLLPVALSIPAPGTMQ